MKRREFLAGTAALALWPGVARADIPQPYDWTAMPPFTDRQAFIDWAVAARGEDPKFLGQRFDRFLVMVANGDLKDDRNKRAFLMTPREEFVLTQNLPRAYDIAFLDIGFGVTISGPHLVGRMTSAHRRADGRQGARDRHRLGLPVGLSRPTSPTRSGRSRSSSRWPSAPARTYDALIGAGYTEFKAITTQERRRLLWLGGRGAVRQDHRHLRHRPHSARRCCSS